MFSMEAHYAARLKAYQWEAIVLQQFSTCYYESKWIDTLLQNNELENAKRFHMTFRLIDDDVAVDCPDFIQLCSCYLDFLTLENTSLDNGSVNFLGMNIKFTKADLILKVHDKRKDYPFKVVRYRPC